MELTFHSTFTRCWMVVPEPFCHLAIAHLTCAGISCPLLSGPLSQDKRPSDRPQAPTDAALCLMLQNCCLPLSGGAHHVVIVADDDVGGGAVVSLILYNHPQNLRKPPRLCRLCLWLVKRCALFGYIIHDSVLVVSSRSRRSR